MCPRDKFEHKLEIMPMNIFRKIIDESVSLGIENIIISGFGDPLMDNYLGERFLYIKNNYSNIKISIINTGQLLEGNKLELVCEFVDIIKISNYGFSKKTYEAVHRGSLVYENIRENIDILLHSKKRPYTIMTFLVLPENHNEMEVWKNHYEPLADRIDIWKPHNWAGGGGTSLPDVIGSCFRALDLSGLQFFTDGSVSLCCMDFNRQLVIGDIKTQSFSEIINSSLLKEIQRMIKNGSILQSNFICKDCDQIRDRKDALIYTSGNMKVGKPSLRNYKDKI
jgi:MoaA/NifB/PqqE/SkfB family radical SAM enzyme